ncbi:hypothetical protein IQ250_24350 [Pseudanabaenaceae cyanobacterium LEGE 13415]|nr:hypothetical protein [Pseudanabaenaceae cyanobacterium LEGE 13415]
MQLYNRNQSNPRIRWNQADRASFNRKFAIKLDLNYDETTNRIYGYYNDRYNDNSYFVMIYTYAMGDNTIRASVQISGVDVEPIKLVTIKQFRYDLYLATLEDDVFDLGDDEKAEKANSRYLKQKRTVRIIHDENPDSKIGSASSYHPQKWIDYASLDLNTIPVLTLINLKQIKNTCSGVYILFSKDRKHILYIGQAISLQQRCTFGRFDREYHLTGEEILAPIDVDRDLLDTVESMLIKNLRPIHNKTHSAKILNFKRDDKFVCDNDEIDELIRRSSQLQPQIGG